MDSARRHVSGVGEEEVVGLLGLTNVVGRGNEQRRSWIMKTIMNATWNGIIVATRTMITMIDAIQRLDV